MKILVFGDSIAQGFYDSQGGWVQQLANYYHSKKLQAMVKRDESYAQVFNLGVSGNTVEDVLQRMESEIKVRREDGESVVLLLAIGLNDTILRENRAVMDVYKFQEEYEKLIDLAKKFTDDVVCMGLTAVDETQTNPWPYSAGGEQWGNNRIDLFEDTIKQSAMRADVTFVPIYDLFARLLSQDRSLLSDGLHPNSDGHTLIAEQVRPVLDDLVGTSE